LRKSIAILGGGPAGLFMFKRLVDAKATHIDITIFEKTNHLGSGMPYSADGANDEHITNVSGNEIPELVTPLANWIKTVPKDTLDKFKIDPNRFNEYKVLPRLLFGQYLTAQFSALQKLAREAGLNYEIHYNSLVSDVIDKPGSQAVLVEINGEQKFEFDHVIICTGHVWPKRNEGIVPNYFDSPYPPLKLALKLDHAVAIKGSSLTAVDAIRTLSRYNGTFSKTDDGLLKYNTHADSPNFKMVMHTRGGMLPAVRFHLEDSHLKNPLLLSDEEIAAHIKSNNGFLSLDYIFERDFKQPIREKDADFFAQIKDMTLEQFVAAMLEKRENIDPFDLLRAEYKEAEKSIKRHQSVYWKEMLGVLSFALNYPAKHLSAEDRQRFQKTLAPLISIVIAYMPQSSSEEMLALHKAGVLELIAVGDDSRVTPGPEKGATYHYTDENGTKKSVYYNTYVDCVGQPHLDFEDLPFKSLIEDRTVTPAKLKFRSKEAGIKATEQGDQVTQDHNGDYYLTVPGVAVNDSFEVVDAYGALNDRIFIMAVPMIGGYNPDYSGLDFGEAASATIAERLLA